MSRRVRIVISCVLVVFAFCAGIFAYAHTYGNKENTANAVTTPKNYFVDKDGKIETPPGANDGSAESRGTETNPFFILEIVPYDGMAKVGYMIDGQEPIDVHAMARDNGTVPGEDKFYTSTTKTFRFWKSEAPDTFLIDSPPTTMTTTQYGIMTRVADGTGQYKRVETLNPSGVVTGVVYETEENGNFTWTPLEIEPCLALTDDQKAEYNQINQPADTVGTQIKMYFENVEYVSGTGKVLEHKDVFLRESIGLAYRYDENGVRHKITNETEINARVDAYKTVVYTVTPEDLNLNLGLIDRADLIFISSQAEMIPSSGDGFSGMYVEAPAADLIDPGTNRVREKYKYVPYVKKDKFGYEEPTGQYGRVLNVPGATFNTNRLSWEAVVKIYENSTDPDGICPIVADFKMYNDTKDDMAESVELRKMSADGNTKNANPANGTQNNLTKLFLLAYQMTNPVFESFYGKLSATGGMFESVPMVDEHGVKLKNKDDSDLTTGKFNYDKDWPHGKKNGLDQDSKVYWNSSTLLPWKLVQNSNKLNSLSDYSAAMAPYQVMIEGGSPYNMTQARNTIRNGFLSFDGDTKVGTDFDWNGSGMTDDQYGYEVYDYFDSINGSAARPGANDITMADCINYLLGGVHGGAQVNTKVYKILELQPSPDYEDVATFWKPLIAAYTESIKDPEIETMTTSEFIGSNVDCMSEYDLIYIGMNKMSSDPALDFSGTDFVYAHTGPKVTIAENYKAMYGWLGTPYNTDREKEFVYSGNDLTELALKKLKQYGQEGFPLLFGGGFYTSSGAVANTVDRNSNIYNLGTTASNRINERALSGLSEAGKLRDMLTTNSKKVDLYFASPSDSPILYSSDITKPDSQRYINGGSNDRTLRYKFTVKAPEGTSYQVKLYVDSNTDGIFKTGEEDLNITVYTTNAIGEANGVAADGVVEAGKTYIVSRTITDRIGSVYWKLTLEKNDGTTDKVFASLSGVSAIKATLSTEQENIVVLQILPKTASPTLRLPTSEADANSIGGSTKMFYDKVKDLNGMNITFKRLKQDEILNRMEHGYIEDGVMYPPNEDYLYDNYDMLVLGFADVYDGVSDPDLITAIERFISYGKAVLYTHDTSSFTGPSGGSFSSWGTTITERLREAFGMDRYAASNNIDPGKVTETIDIPYSPADGSSPLGQIYKNSVSGKALVQGFTNGTLWRCLYPAESGDPDGNVNSTKVSRVNVGAITEYPYNIPEEISVEDTHPQYYQLDMEEEDIVVWYCLAGGSGGRDYENKFFGASPNDVRNNYYIYNKGNVTYSGMGHKLNNGSVSLTEKEIELFVNTFVAAYRAAAQPVKVQVMNDEATSDSVGQQFLPVDVDSSDPDDIIGKDISDTYRLQTVDTDGVGYKQSSTETKKSKRVYFKLVDNNTYGSSEYDLKIVLNNGALLDGIQVDGTVTGKMFAVYEQGSDQFVDTQVRKYEAADSKIYYVDVPITLEDATVGKVVATTEVTITVKMTYKIGTKEFSVFGDTKVSIMPRGFFNLD